MIENIQSLPVAPLIKRATAFLRGRCRKRWMGVAIGTLDTTPLQECDLSRPYSSLPHAKCIMKSFQHTHNTIFKRSNGTDKKMEMTTVTANRVGENNQQKRCFKVFLSVGSNQGDSFGNISTGLQLLCDPSFFNSCYRPTNFVRSSFLYLTKPMYVADQASFWNGAVELDTDHDPTSLLHRLKLVEKHLGRDFAQIRNGPRPLDLDILLCYQTTESTLTPVILETPNLVIPHSRLQEREFVLAPLIDIMGRESEHPLVMKVPSSSSEKANFATFGDLLDGIIVKNANDDTNEPVTTRLIPLPRKRVLLFNETIIMGILNVTPDSFSDGGKWTDSVDRAVARALEMVDEGATIVDIGGESTRPGATEICIGEQISRTVPVIKAIRKRSKEIVLSIDTRHAAVAKAAIEAGADIVNDVSGGTHDPNMFSTVASLQVPIVIMHMRGDPKTMQSLTNYDEEGGVVDGVINALLERSQAAEKAGIPRWMQIFDPGIGFAKDLQGNLTLLKNYAGLRSKLGDFPLLLGTSRKGFIGKLCGKTVAEERDFGTVGSCVTALCFGINQSKNCLGCNILRVHNVKGAKEATLVMDAIVGLSK